MTFKNWELILKLIKETWEGFDSIDLSKGHGEVPITSIPKGALERPYYVKTESDMLTLTIDDVQNGDTVVATGYDPAHMYLVVDDSKLGTMEAFEQYKGGAASSVNWRNIVDKPEFSEVAFSGSYNDLKDRPLNGEEMRF